MYVPKRMKYIYKVLYMGVHANIVHNSQKVETAPMSIN